MMNKNNAKVIRNIVLNNISNPNHLTMHVSNIQNEIKIKGVIEILLSFDTVMLYLFEFIKFRQITIINQKQLGLKVHLSPYLNIFPVTCTHFHLPLLQLLE